MKSLTDSTKPRGRYGRADELFSTQPNGEFRSGFVLQPIGASTAIYRTVRATSPGPFYRHIADEIQNLEEKRFQELADEWQEETSLKSSITDIVSHSAYLEIIGMGRQAIPMLLRQLEHRPNHWFVALQAITQENPVDPVHRGNIKAMADDWIEWGAQAGYLGG